MKQKYKISNHPVLLTSYLKFTVYKIKLSGIYFEHTDAGSESSGIIIISGLMFKHRTQMLYYLQISKCKVVHVL
jgi:hypothetical protein